MRRIYKSVSTIKHSLFFTLFGFSHTCQMNPSCSEYTLLQIKKNGTIIGLSQGLWRVLHCR